MHKNISQHSKSQQINNWALELGFQQVGICSPDLSEPRAYLSQWLSDNFHGEMAYMRRHEIMRTNPEQLLSNCKSVLMVRMDYLPEHPEFDTLEEPSKAFISRYAQNRDYHKLIRKRLEKLAKKIQSEVGPFKYRCCADSAPIMEKPLAQQAGLGWVGKHTNLINSKAGSWFFLGTLLLDIELPPTESFDTNHCGSCTKCIEVCPTKAIVAPYQLDARRCISYLTIELRTSIPVEFRKAMGNRIYGCDDCQLFCPWNKFAKPTQEVGFQSTRGLSTPDLIELFLWDEETFLQKTEGSAIRRIDHECWLRNIAIALGNAPKSEAVIEALQSRLAHPSEMVREHVEWALQEQRFPTPRE